MSLKKRILTGLVVVTALVAMIACKVVIESRGEFVEAVAMEADGLDEEAVVHYGRAIRWYAPGNPYVRRSAEALWRIADRIEAGGDPVGALRTFRELRSALYSVRHVTSPYAETIGRAEERIAALAARQGEAGDDHGSYDRILGQLRERTGPDPLWSIVLVAGFLGWIGSAFAFIWKVFGGEATGRMRRAFVWGGFFAGFFLIWIIGMMRA